MERGVSRQDSVGTRNQPDNAHGGCISSAFIWLRSCNCKIYCEQALSSWGDRMWSFAIGLYLAMLSPSSLRLTAIYGFSSALSLIIFGAPIGKWIDRTPRLKAARTALVLQNCFVVICTALLAFSIYFTNEIRGIYYELLLYVAIILAAVLSDLASAASRISIGKDWIVVVANDNKELAYMNAMLRRIDLTSLICAPIVVGQIMTYTSMLNAATFIAVWNIASMFLENFMLSAIYSSNPNLSIKYSAGETRDRRASNPVIESQEGRNFLSNYVNSWKLYFNQRVVFAGLGLSFLYMTVLGFDTITQGYANQQGVSASLLGGLSAIGAVVGILGTLAYPRIRDHIGIVRTGLYGFFTEVACLVLCVISVWMPGSPFNPTAWCSGDWLQPKDNATTMHNHTRLTRSIDQSFNLVTESFVNESQPLIELLPEDARPFTSIALLMTGIVTARFGLWMVDLTVNQLLQQEVDESHRGTINGVQNSLNMSMDMLKFILVIAFPCHETFGYLIIISFVFICFGWISYCVYSYKMRGHIIPWHKLRNNSSSLQSDVVLEDSTLTTHM